MTAMDPLNTTPATIAGRPRKVLIVDADVDALGALADHGFTKRVVAPVRRPAP